MQVVYEKLAILDEYLVDHCWMITRDHHLDVIMTTHPLAAIDLSLSTICNSPPTDQI